MRIAVIDIGTNSFLCLVADVSGQGQITVVQDIERVVRLGEKINLNRFFLPEALARADATLRELSQIIKSFQVDHLFAVATSAARDSTNSHELLEIGRRNNIPIHIITGQLEAQLGFQGVAPELVQDLVMVDVGGGSTEIAYKMSESSAFISESFNIGTVRLTEMFVTKQPISDAEFAKMSTYTEVMVNSHCEEIKRASSLPLSVIAVAGTPVALGCMIKKVPFALHNAEGLVIDVKTLRKLNKELQHMTIDERSAFSGLDRMRADVIVSGGVVLERILTLLGASSMKVSAKGVRHGAAMRWREFT